MSSDGWLYGRDGHIKNGDVIGKSWELDFTVVGLDNEEKWVPTSNAGDSVGSGDAASADKYRKPAREGCECPKCTTQVPSSEDMDKAAKEGIELGKRFAERTKGMHIVRMVDTVTDRLEAWKRRAKKAETRVVELEAALASERRCRETAEAGCDELRERIDRIVEIAQGRK